MAGMDIVRQDPDIHMLMSMSPVCSLCRISPDYANCLRQSSHRWHSFRSNIDQCLQWLKCCRWPISVPQRYPWERKRQRKQWLYNLNRIQLWFFAISFHLRVQLSHPHQCVDCNVKCTWMFRHEKPKVFNDIFDFVCAALPCLICIEAETLSNCSNSSSISAKRIKIPVSARRELSM